MFSFFSPLTDGGRDRGERRRRRGRRGGRREEGERAEAEAVHPPSERSLRVTSRESLHWCCHFKEIGNVHLVSWSSDFMHFFVRAKCKHVLRLREVRGAMKNTASQHSFHLILSKIPISYQLQQLEHLHFRHL